MIVDTSALVAILRAEPDAESFALALAADRAPRMSVANYLEAAIVIDSARHPVASRQVDKLVARAGLSVEPVTVEQAQVARAAYRDFGRGSGHPEARLRRLLRLRARPLPRRAADGQGRRLRSHRRRVGS